MTVSYLSEGGTYKPDFAVFSRSDHCCLMLSGKYGFNVSIVTSCRVKSGSVDMGCVGHDCSPGISLFGKGLSSTGNNGSPVTLSNTNTKPCLVAKATASILFPSSFTGHSCCSYPRSYTLRFLF